jgi:hypothetical protein
MLPILADFGQASVQLFCNALHALARQSVAAFLDLLSPLLQENWTCLWYAFDS